jgi:hypothetical protein
MPSFRMSKDSLREFDFHLSGPKVATAVSRYPTSLLSRTNRFGAINLHLLNRAAQQVTECHS